MSTFLMFLPWLILSLATSDPMFLMASSQRGLGVGYGAGFSSILSAALSRTRARIRRSREREFTDEYVPGQGPLFNGIDCCFPVGAVCGDLTHSPPVNRVKINPRP
jgi:hypothetical protein